MVVWWTYFGQSRKKEPLWGNGLWSGLDEVGFAVGISEKGPFKAEGRERVEASHRTINKHLIPFWYVFVIEVIITLFKSLLLFSLTLISELDARNFSMWKLPQEVQFTFILQIPLIIRKFLLEAWKNCNFLLFLFPIYML